MKIGVTGTFCAGKDTFAEYLIQQGYEHISLSDMIREECSSRGFAITRDNLQRIGNEMRGKEGAGILAKKAIAKMNPSKNYVITSIRNPLEVKELAKSKNFTLVKIDAPIELRFKRILERGRKENDPSTLEEFQESERREMESADENSQKIKDCMDMALFTIINDSLTKDEFYSKIKDSLPAIEAAAAYTRPTWDEYFIELMKVIGTRGTCNRGRSGCVIVKDKRVVATGYVGAPAGLAHCDEVGHWFKKTIHEDGNITQHCIRTVHAEANAIAQAAKYGINIDGATLYCKMEPCLDCTKLLISAGIKRVVCDKRYQAAKESREMLEEAGIKLDVIHDELESYVKLDRPVNAETKKLTLA